MAVPVARAVLVWWVAGVDSAARVALAVLVVVVAAVLVAAAAGRT